MSKHFILPVPSSIALSYDRDNDPPDWPAIKEAVVNDHLTLDHLALINRVEDLWEHPEKREHVTKVRVRSADVLAVGGSTREALLDRRAIQFFKDYRLHTKAGFDGALAAGTWDCQFAFWLTPGDISTLIEEGHDYDPADFEPEAIAKAARDMVCSNEWAYSVFNIMRDDVIAQAKEITREMREAKEPAVTA